MSDISLETCTATKEQGNNKLSYTVASCWSFYKNLIFFPKALRKPAGGRAISAACCVLPGRIWYRKRYTTLMEAALRYKVCLRSLAFCWHRSISLFICTRPRDTHPFYRLLLINDEGSQNETAAVSEHKSMHELWAILSTEMTLTFYMNYTASVCNNCVSYVSKCYTKCIHQSVFFIWFEGDLFVI